MSNGNFANEKVMEDYLSALLDEPEVEDKVQRQSVEKLLEKAQVEIKPTVPVVEKVTETIVEPIVAPVVPVVSPAEPQQLVDTKEIEQEVETLEVENVTAKVADKVKDEPFQALYFEVAGLTLAVPLTELGGIHQLEKIGPLFGKPNWFKGVMLHREAKLNVVDTATWVMPEKFNEKLAENLNYQYLIMLDESGWGLACESLVNTVTLQPDDVRWRGRDTKRPWLAGMVKEKMCALIDVAALVAMLNQGLNSNQE